MLANNFVFIIGTILVGIIARRSKIFPPNAQSILATFIINVAYPAIVLLNVPKISSLNQMLIPVAIHWVSLSIHFAILLGLNKLIKFDREIFWTLLVASTLGNTGFLGIPMITALFGEDKILAAILYDQLGSGISFSLFGLILIPLYRNEPVGNWKLIVRRMLTFPPFVALIIGFFLRGISYPVAVEFFLSKLSATLVPLAIFAVGLDFSFRIKKSSITPVSVGLGVKMILIPLIMIGLVSLLSIPNSEALRVSLIQTGMPPMVTAGILAITSGLNRPVTASLVGLGLIISFLTLPLLHSLL